MATRRLNSNELEGDSDALTAIKALSDYTPMNAAFSTAILEQLDAAMNAAQAAELRAKNAWAAARDAAQTAEWALHNAVLGAKTQIVAQYGNNSDAIASIGLKKKNEYKRPTRRKAESTPA